MTDVSGSIYDRKTAAWRLDTFHDTLRSLDFGQPLLKRRNARILRKREKRIRKYGGPKQGSASGSGMAFKKIGLRAQPDVSPIFAYLEDWILVDLLSIFMIISLIFQKKYIIN